MIVSVLDPAGQGSTTASVFAAITASRSVQLRLAIVSSAVVETMMVVA